MMIIINGVQNSFMSCWLCNVYIGAYLFPFLHNRLKLSPYTWSYIHVMLTTTTMYQDISSMKTTSSLSLFFFLFSLYPCKWNIILPLLKHTQSTYIDTHIYVNAWSWLLSFSMCVLFAVWNHLEMIELFLRRSFFPFCRSFSTLLLAYRYININDFHYLFTSSSIYFFCTFLFYTRTETHAMITSCKVYDAFIYLFKKCVRKV